MENKAIFYSVITSINTLSEIISERKDVQQHAKYIMYATVGAAVGAIICKKNETGEINTEE